MINDLTDVQQTLSPQQRLLLGIPKKQQSKNRKRAYRTPCALFFHSPILPSTKEGLFGGESHKHAITAT